jgi:hypothetical protein
MKDLNTLKRQLILHVNHMLQVDIDKAIKDHRVENTRA